MIRDEIGRESKSDREKTFHESGPGAHTIQAICLFFCDFCAAGRRNAARSGVPNYWGYVCVYPPSSTPSVFALPYVFVCLVAHVLVRVLCYYFVPRKKLKNVSCEYHSLNGCNSTLQAAWYIRHVRTIWFLWTKHTIWLLVLNFTQNIVRAFSMFYHEGYRLVTPLDDARVNRTIFHNHSVHWYYITLIEGRDDIKSDIIRAKRVSNCYIPPKKSVLCACVRLILVLVWGTYYVPDTYVCTTLYDTRYVLCTRYVWYQVRIMYQIPGTYVPHLPLYY